MSILGELKQRRVFQTAAIYVAVALGVTEIVVTVVDNLYLPPWVSTLAVIGFIAGFPVAMFLAWTFDLTENGVRRTDVSSRKGQLSIAVAVALLLVCTAGLFVLIKPTSAPVASVDIAPNSIAVMPFDNAGADRDVDYLVAGLADELRDQLGQVAGLKLAARSSSLAARSQGLDATAVSEKLGVAVLVEGSIRRRRNELVVSVELVDGASGLVIWSGSFNRAAAEIMSVQHSIATQLLAHVSPGEEAQPSPTPSSNSNASEFMMLARYYETQVRDQQDVDSVLLSKAIENYRKATEIDSESAVAHSRLARALMYANDFAAAEAPIYRAVTLDPERSEVQNTLGNYYLATGVRGAGHAFRRAAELNPNNADALADYAWWLWMQSHSAEAEPLYLRALELDPLSLSRYGALADYYGYTARIPEALDIAERVRQTFDDAASFRLIARIMELVGRLDASIAWTIKARDLEPDNDDHVRALAELYAEIGDFDTAGRLSPDASVGLLFKMRRYQDVIDEGEYLLLDQPDDLELQILLSFSYTISGRPDLAVRLLTLAGIPERSLGETRHPVDVEGLIYLIDALDAVGEEALATKLAVRWVERPHVNNGHWWVHLYLACPLAVQGKDDAALQRLERAGDSARLPWQSLLADMRCFQRYSGNSRYQAILADVETRRSEQLQRLPATLKEFGVSL